MTQSTPMRPLTGKDIPADVGIVIGRFQIHELHEAHRDVIDTVRAKHDRVIIFVGLSPLRNTSRNPLDFNTRKKMIQETYPDIEVYYIEDNPSDKVWSKNLDREIEKWLKPYQKAVIYGSRDSFIPYYSGRYPTVELEATKYISATELRRRLANSSASNLDVRKGIITASFNRYPTCYATVDIAIIDKDKGRVLMCRKPGEEHVRFVGGFATPDSDSFESDARREVMEETGLEVGDLTYIGSAKIEDWRYKGEVDKIKTMMYVGTYLFGRPEANDDISSVEWVSLTDLVSGVIQVMPEHEVLVDLLTKYVRKAQ